MNSKKVIVSATSLLLVGQLVLGANSAFAQTTTPSPKRKRKIR